MQTMQVLFQPKAPGAEDKIPVHFVMSEQVSVEENTGKRLVKGKRVKLKADGGEKLLLETRDWRERQVLDGQRNYDGNLGQEGIG